MYAVVETGGKQLRVSEGQTVRVERIPGEPGQEVVLDRVLMVSGEQTLVGTPWVPGARVVARIVQQGKGRKVTVFKYKPKVRYRRKRGHRQLFTALRIERIELPA
ncbi:MAG: 50S ribosomal protein L21 [Armatimonadota bacterium]|nr:50S ribosomal protein L21 [Armatimonadota bacterium]MDR5688886.1 50S ribosomal protein L21 [Armatimonadota bacterium]MDR7390427.1 50S ribosomal protein L21 [Armatimonadota bacterium]MDR7392666.1 50S ribosomal protein L21 [Armatimonadota bacterium]MDR7395276.1 50S ribosomal protein L21 [Armatimonadota bacterium]